MLNSSVLPIDMTLLGAIISGQSGPESDDKKAVLPIPHTPALLEPHHQIG